MYKTKMGDEDMELTVIEGRQGTTVIYTGFISATDLINKTDIDRWEPGKPIEEQGCQRAPVPSHFRKIGRKLKEDQTATLPTSVTLTMDEANSKVNIIPTPIENVYKIKINKGNIYISDGMHRRYGLEYALKDLKLDELSEERIRNMKIPFCLIMTADRVAQIKMFYEINSTAKRVPTDLALQLLNEINNENAYIKKTNSEKLKLVALNVCNELNQIGTSVWYNSIDLSGNDKSKIASTTSFVTSLLPMLKISFVKEIIKKSKSEREASEKIIKLIYNYWAALAKVMPDIFPVENYDKAKWCIQKTPGLYILHLVGAYVIEECMYKREKLRNFEVDTIANFMRSYCDYGFTEYKTFWMSSDRHNDIVGGEASRANSNKEFNMLAKDIINDISENYCPLEDELVF